MKSMNIDLTKGKFVLAKDASFHDLLLSSRAMIVAALYPNTTVDLKT